MAIRPIFAWYDLWVGAFWDAGKRRLYILPLPCIGVVIDIPHRGLGRLERIASDHWIRGGSGVTNFDRDRLPVYQAAIAKHGDPSLRLSDLPMTGGGGEGSSYYSLHHFGIGDLSQFWRVFNAVAEATGGHR